MVLREEAHYATQPVTTEMALPWRTVGQLGTPQEAMAGKQNVTLTGFLEGKKEVMLQCQKRRKRQSGRYRWVTRELAKRLTERRKSHE